MLKAFQTILLVSVLAIISVKTCKAIVYNAYNVIEAPIKPQIVKHEVSDESNVIKLKCKVQKNSSKRNGIMSINELRWEHKKCGYGLHLTNCANFPTIPWTPVMCKNGSKICDSNVLKLENTKTADSGYYRCLYKNYMSKQFRVYKIFHVDVYDPEASLEILDELSHYDRHMVHVNDTVTFRCRARSLFPLHMIWAKLVLHQEKVDRYIQYGVNTYELINNDGCYYIGDDLYMSKMTLSSCQISDSGKYYCIVISVNNAQMMKNKTAILTVVPRMQNMSNSLQTSFQLVFVWIYLIYFPVL